MTSQLAQAAPSATEQLLNLGLPGIAILGLVAALLYQVRRNDKLLDKLDGLTKAYQAKLDAEHVARLTDQRENTKVLLEVHDQTGENLKILEKAVDRLPRP